MIEPLRAGRRGRYVCPFCRRVESQEDLMIEHRRVSEKCRELNDTLRQGVGQLEPSRP